MIFLRRFFVSALLMGLTFVVFSQNSEQLNIIDGVVERTIQAEKAPLTYESLREADVSWEKKIWRIIDVREKINLAFVYPNRPFYEILKEGVASGDLTVFSAETDDFSIPMDLEEAMKVGVTVDTIIVPSFEPTHPEDDIQIIRNEVDYTEIKRFRLKEVWFFDEESARMQVRIIGIAPIVEVLDEAGNFKYEQPMYWLYYPQLRDLLAKEQSPHFDNDAHPITWEDILEMRYFSSYVYKASNVRDERIKDYIAGNMDQLLEAEKIEHSLFNLEQDLWSY
ncbi:MAG: gliding motility protein GldN [Bacteroidota bacterium]